MKKRQYGNCLLLFLSLLCIAVGMTGIWGENNLMEYVAPFSASGGNNIPIQYAMDDLISQIPDAQVAACVLKEQYWVQTALGAETACSITGITPGWFDLYPHRISDGRLFGEAEINSGNCVALLTPELAYALWGDMQIIGNEISINGSSFRIVGVIEPMDQGMQTKYPGLYIPMQEACQLVQPEIQILSGIDIQINLFESVAKRYIPNGTAYSHEKECMTATMPLRCLVVIIMMYFLLHVLHWIKATVALGICRWKERYRHVYASRMILPTILLCMKLMTTFGIWLCFAYGTLRIAVEPVYVFSEWIPDDLSSLRSYIDTFSCAVHNWSALQVTQTGAVLHIRRYGTLIQMGCILFLSAMALSRIKLSREIDNDA